MLGTASIGGWKHCCYSNLINEEAVMVTGKILRGSTVRIQQIVVFRRMMWFSVIGNKPNTQFLIMQAFSTINFCCFF